MWTAKFRVQTLEEARTKMLLHVVVAIPQIAASTCQNLMDSKTRPALLNRKSDRLEHQAVETPTDRQQPIQNEEPRLRPDPNLRHELCRRSLCLCSAYMTDLMTQVSSLSFT